MGDRHGHERAHPNQAASADASCEDADEAADPADSADADNGAHATDAPAGADACEEAAAEQEPRSRVLTRELLDTTRRQAKAFDTLSS